MKIENLVNVMIENEFHKIQEFKESDDLKDNKEYQADQENSVELFKQLSEILKAEQKNLLLEFEELMMHNAVDLSKYYFKQGIIAAFNELECLKYVDISVR